MSNIRLVLYTLLALFLPVKPVLLVVMALTAIDLCFGVAAAIKRGESITSAGLKRTIVKVFVYETVILLAFLVEQYLVGDILPLVKILSGYIGLTELKSCLENLEDITGVPILQALIDKVAKAREQ